MNIKELESQLKSIESRAANFDEIKVKVEGTNESTGSISISEVSQVPPSFSEKRGGSATVRRSPSNASVTQEIKLLDVNLSDVHVPDEYIQEKFRAAISNRDKSGELPGVVLRQIGSSELWQVEQDYTYTTESFDSTEHTLTAVQGYKYDRASIPRIFWVIIDKDSLSAVPALFHDLLYQNGGVLPTNQVSPYRTFSRDEADDLFLELMQKSGVGYVRRLLAYQAVKRFSGFAWQTRII